MAVRAVVSVYCIAIIRGLRTFESVLDRDKQDVQAELLRQGYGIDGKKLPKEPIPEPEPTPEPTPEEPIESP